MPELTIASFNIHWGRGSRRDDFPPFDVVAACSTFEADVIVLQETWGADGGVAQQEEIAEALGMRCLSVPMARVAMDPHPRVVGRPQAGEGASEGASGGDGAGDGESSLALLSRKPIRSSRTIALPHLPLDPWSRALLHAEIDVDGTNLAVVATHFTHLEHGAPLHAGALRRGLPPSDRPAALIGDLNMWGWTIDAMAPRGWRRAFRGKTWPAPRPRHQIDHLLVTPSVEVIRGEVLGDMGSDHRPIRARLRVT